MSVRVMSWVFEHSQATGNDRLVLLAIADRCDDDGGNCWKSTEKLAEKAKVSKRTAQRCIDHLVEMGELAVVERLGLTSVLSVVMGGRQVDAPTGDKLTPRQVDTGDTADARGGDTGDARYILEPSTTPQPPADAGLGTPDHCDKHSRYRRSCHACRTRALAVAAERFAENERARASLSLCAGCDPDGWAFDHHGEVTARRCDHRRAS